MALGGHVTDYQAVLLSTLRRLERRRGHPIAARDLARAIGRNPTHGGFRQALRRLEELGQIKQTYPRGPWTAVAGRDTEEGA